MTTAVSGKLLIVDDDATQMRALCATLEAEGYLAEGFTSAKESLAHLREHPFDLLLTDLTMPEMDGIELLKAAQEADPHIVGIVMTGHASVDTAVSAMKAGALDYILKPFTLRAVRPVLQRALTVRKLLGENEELRRTEETIRRLNRDLEKTVDDRTQQLTEANRELEAFSQSVSHDLRAPLRAINGFGGFLLTEYNHVLDERARGYVNRILGAGARMEQLIGDLMRLSHAAGVELRSVSVDLSQLAASIVADLREREPSRHVDVAIESDMSCCGDPQLLRIALENLISNAWKFTRDVRGARIDVGRSAGVPDGFFVRDNGAGFEPEQAKNLFAPFRRLHTSAQFPGTGVGLSIVQRIIRRHGGRLSAQGAVGQGATFSFTVPGQAGAAQAANHS
jgi:two-component system, sensor histidine kinase and response regulator